MRYLFIHQNFPGQFLHLVRHLARSRENEIVFISEENSNQIPGVRKVTYPPAPPPNQSTFRDAVDFEAGLVRARALGLLAEEIDTRNGELLGNFPQAFSHVGLITAAAEIDGARERAR